MLASELEGNTDIREVKLDVYGKRERAKMKLSVSLQLSEIICICNKKEGTLFHFCVV